jgi:hypothetical protein
MSDKKILSKKLDWILMEMVRYSFTLGDWGKDVRIEIYLEYDGDKVVRYDAESRSLDKGIYLSFYNYDDNYEIIFNPRIRELRKNMRKMKDIIKNIETLAIGIYKIVVNSYLDPLEKYDEILIRFRRGESDYNKINEEIKESTIFGHSIPKKYEFADQPVFEFKALKEKKKDTNDDEIELSNPDYYKFSFKIYEL